MFRGRKELSINELVSRYDLTHLSKYYDFSRKYKSNAVYYPDLYFAIQSVNSGIFKSRYDSSNPISIVLVKGIPVIKLLRNVVVDNILEIKRSVIIDLHGYELKFINNAFIKIVENPITHVRPDFMIYGKCPNSKIESESRFIVLNEVEDKPYEISTDETYSDTGLSMTELRHPDIQSGVYSYADLKDLVFTKYSSTHWYDSNSEKSYTISRNCSKFEPDDNSIYIIGGTILHNPKDLSGNDRDKTTLTNYHKLVSTIRLEYSNLYMYNVSLTQISTYYWNDAISLYRGQNFTMCYSKIKVMNIHSLVSPLVLTTSISTLATDNVTLKNNDIYTQAIYMNLCGVYINGGNKVHLEDNKIQTILSNYINSGYGVRITNARNSLYSTPTSTFKNNDIEGAAGGIGISTPNQHCYYLSGRSVSWNTGHGGAYVSNEAIFHGLGGRLGCSKIQKYPGASGMSYFGYGATVYLDNVEFINEDSEGTSTAFVLKQGSYDYGITTVYCSNCRTNGMQLRVDAPHKLVLGKRGMTFGDGTTIGS